MEEWRYLLVNTRGVFRIQSNICDGVFLKLKAVNYFHKKALSYLEPGRIYTMQLFFRKKLATLRLKVTIFGRKLHRRFSTEY